MKRIIALFIAVLSVFSLVSCKKSQKLNLEVNGSVEIAAREKVLPIIGIQDAFNPLTGEYNLARERIGERPYVVTVNNLRQARPQYGISKAELVFEILAEGGVTRLMCAYSDLREIERIGSVRSQRDQFLEATAFLDPVFIHVGYGTCVAYLIKENYNLDAIDIERENPAGDSIRIIDEEIRKRYAVENSWFIDGTKIDESMKTAEIEKGRKTSGAFLDFVSKEDPLTVPTGGEASRIRFSFSGFDYGSESYNGEFRYDEKSGTYLKWQFGQPQIDALYDNIQIGFENVLVLFAEIGQKGKPYQELTNIVYQTGGTGYYLTNGRYEEIAWGKGDFYEPFWFRRADGSPLKLNIGKTYFGIADREYSDRTVIE